MKSLKSSIDIINERQDLQLSQKNGIGSSHLSSHEQLHRLSGVKSSGSPIAFTSQDARNLREIASDSELDALSDNDIAVTKKGIASYALSALLHLIILLFLTFLLLPSPPSQIEVQAIFSEEVGDQLDLFTEDEGNLNPNEAQDYKINVQEELRIEDFSVFEKIELPFDKRALNPEFDQARNNMSEMLSGRVDPGLKNDLLAKYGGNRLTEEAVEAGLKWLQKQQGRDGSWSLLGPYSGGIMGKIDNKPAATALALLAFQGAGNTTSSGKYSSVVRRGWNWLRRQQDAEGSFVPSERVHEAYFYTQALCALALCELITLEKTPSPALKEKAQQAIDHLLEHQNRELGGWKYDFQSGSDLSVTGWCLMALKTAEMAKLSVPQTAYDRISSFLDSVSYNDGAEYGYETTKGEILEINKRPSMTAAGLLCREYLGWEPTHRALQRGAATLIEPCNLILFPPEKNASQEFKDKRLNSNVYGCYASSMALKGLGPYNQYWRIWNKVLSSELPKRQVPPNSQEAGSWNPDSDEYAFGGGRLYVTCLSILSLEVYYRHLSIY